ncbi:hypothetical protein MRX96_000609 [Rhipicephalus microplus]
MCPPSRYIRDERRARRTDPSRQNLGERVQLLAGAAAPMVCSLGVASWPLLWAVREASKKRISKIKSDARFDEASAFFFFLGPLLARLARLDSSSIADAKRCADWEV